MAVPAFFGGPPGGRKRMFRKKSCEWVVLLLGELGGHKIAGQEENWAGTGSKWVSFPGLGAHYIHAPRGHARNVLDSGVWEKPFGADFTR